MRELTLEEKNQQASALSERLSEAIDDYGHKQRKMMRVTIALDVVLLVLVILNALTLFAHVLPVGCP